MTITATKVMVGESFFFQAEDGIRDKLVTWSSDVCSSDLGPAGRGLRGRPPSRSRSATRSRRSAPGALERSVDAGNSCRALCARDLAVNLANVTLSRGGQIGRASCRERV